MIPLLLKAAAAWVLGSFAVACMWCVAKLAAAKRAERETGLDPLVIVSRRPVGPVLSPAQADMARAARVYWMALQMRRLRSTDVVEIMRDDVAMPLVAEFVSQYGGVDGLTRKPEVSA
jgi:hypothetical protein